MSRPGYVKIVLQRLNMATRYIAVTNAGNIIPKYTGPRYVILLAAEPTLNLIDRLPASKAYDDYEATSASTLWWRSCLGLRRCAETSLPIQRDGELQMEMSTVKGLLGKNP